MSRRTEMERDRQALKSVVALLFTLADLAERMSRRSAPVRLFVLWFLRQAEAVGWRFATRHSDATLPEQLNYGGDDDLAEAMRLAISFRTLALILQVLPMDGPCPSPGRSDRDFCDTKRKLHGLAQRVPLLDTS